MKKLTAALLTSAMVVSLAACGSNTTSNTASNTTSNTTTADSENEVTTAEAEESTAAEAASDSDDGAASGSVDMSQFPADFADWDVNDLNNYFVEAGVFTEEDWIYTQPHADYYYGTGINDGAGYMDQEGLCTIAIFTVDESSEEVDMQAFMQYIRDNHTFDESLSNLPVDHILGHVLFMTSYCVDEDVYNAMEAAIEELSKAVGVELEY